MIRWIRSAPDWLEVVVVLAVTMGWLVWTSTMQALGGSGDGYVMTSSSALGLVGYEVAVTAVALGLLRLRGKFASHYGCSVSGRLLAAGVALAFAFYAAFVVGYFATHGLFGASAVRGVPLESEVALIPLLLLVIVNPFFEELFAAGYLITTLRRFGPLVAVAASVALRMSYHSYQGPPGFIMSLTGGVLFGLVYYRWRQLFPLMVAHMILDAVGLFMRSG